VSKTVTESVSSVTVLLLLLIAQDKGSGFREVII
jgi:hypothetical protein